jgi:glycosyltransferase involved in cell wall biosynthesis
MLGKVLLFANTDWYLYNFRISLAEKLRDYGCEVVLISPSGEYGQRLLARGFRWIPFEFSTRSKNPLREVGVLKALRNLYLQEKPDLVHHFTIKCVLYGSLIAGSLKTVKVVNSITGLGHIFTDHGFQVKVLRPLVRVLYKLAINYSNSQIIFQNEDDLKLFLNKKLTTQEKAHLIRGSGVSGDKFRYLPLRNKSADDACRLLFASRLMKEKGIFELLEAFENLLAKGLNLELLIAGDIYPGNPTSLTNADLNKFMGHPKIKYLGHVEDMPSLLGHCDIVVLPSYREGTPRILIEAAACGKPIIATDIAGCRGLVIDNVNGFTVPIKSSLALADVIEKLHDDYQKQYEFGLNGRNIFENSFSDELVLEKTISIYKDIL